MRNSLLVIGLLSIVARAHADTRPVEAWTNDGYAAATCPVNYSVEGCDFDNGSSCDNTSQSRYNCRADSRNHRECHITAYCRRAPQTVQIADSTDNGYVEARCPVGFVRQSCDFDPNSCDNTHEGYASCGADSHHNRDCHFTGICVANR